MMAASSVGLVITATTFIVREGPIVRTSMSRYLQSLASGLGANSAAPLHPRRRIGQRLTGPRRRRHRDVHQCFECHVRQIGGLHLRGRGAGRQERRHQRHGPRRT
jgi:hypothetical protein